MSAELNQGLLRSNSCQAVTAGLELMTSGFQPLDYPASSINIAILE